MKKKTINAISVVALIVFGIVGVPLLFYIYDMHNGNVTNISVYDELKETEVFDGVFEQNMQEFFQKSSLERKGEPILTAQQVKKLAQKIFYENYGLESVTTYRPYSVSHDDEAGMWFVYAVPGVYKIIPSSCHFGYCLLVTDDGYIVATFIW